MSRDSRRILNLIGLIFFASFALYTWEGYSQGEGFWQGVVALVNLAAMFNCVLVLWELGHED